MPSQPVRREEEPMSSQPAQKPSETGGELSAWRFRIAVLLYGRAVYRLAGALLRDAREAEDVTQEAFLSYWQHGAVVERPREWLLKVARNAALGRLRKSGRLVSHEQQDLPEASHACDPAWHYEQRELADELRKLVDSLPEPQRSLLVMFDVQGLDGATCARVLGLNVNQVKVYLHRARRRLRMKLEQRS
jgi:RNA polymerase sigma-70 factor (ECF subfamily)